MALTDPSFGTGGEAILAEPGVGIFYHSPDYSHAIPQVEHGRQRFESIPLNSPIFTQLSSYLHDQNYLKELRA
jgi:hypothetical protein